MSTSLFYFINLTLSYYSAVNFFYQPLVSLISFSGPALRTSKFFVGASWSQNLEIVRHLNFTYCVNDAKKPGILKLVFRIFIEDSLSIVQLDVWNLDSCLECTAQTVDTK